jgi:Rrf2 family protein
MILNQETDYGFRIILFLSREVEGKRIEAIEISKKECIPERFLFKIMRKLTKAGIVKSYRGVNGGFTLARSPVDITLLDIVEAVEGPICINVCFKGSNRCNKNFTDFCVVHRELASIRQDISSRLGASNFKMLVEQENKLKEEGDSCSGQCVSFSNCSK